jgi:hypothetical protein
MDNEVGRTYVRETAWFEKVAGGENSPRRRGMRHTQKGKKEEET